VQVCSRFQLPVIREEPDADPAVTLKSGVLESSNVNPSQTLVQMIQLSRQYELQIRAIHSADENAQSASRLLQMT